MSVWGGSRAVVLETLAGKVRLLSLDQAVRLVGGSTESNLRRDVFKALIEDGLVWERRVMSLPLPIFLGPLATWKPGEPELPEEVIEDATCRGRSRWRGAARMVSVVEITRRGQAFVTGGSHARHSRETEVSHDLGLAEVFLSRPKSAQQDWRIEGHYDLGPAFRSGKKPDAVVSGRGCELIGGRYRSGHLIEMAKALMSAELAFELW